MFLRIRYKLAQRVNVWGKREVGRDNKLAPSGLHISRISCHWVTHFSKCGDKTYCIRAGKRPYLFLDVDPSCFAHSKDKRGYGTGVDCVDLVILCEISEISCEDYEIMENYHTLLTRLGDFVC